MSFPSQLRAAHTERLLRVVTCVAASGHRAAVAPFLAASRAFYSDAQLWAELVRHRGPLGRTRLMHAAMQGEVARARFLLERGAAVAVGEAAGEDATPSPLLHACHPRWRPAMVRFLAEQGADVNAAGRNGKTALIFACENKDLAAVRLLVERGAGTNAVEEEECGLTVLMLAMRAGEFDTARFLLDHGANAGATDGVGTPALMYACENDQLDMVRLLVERGADVNATDEDGQTALMRAADYSLLHIARFLLEHGANASAADSAGLTTLMRICERMEESEDELDFLRFLLGRGAVINTTKAVDGDTALIRACEEENFAAAKILIESGADVSAGRRSTAMMWACVAGDLCTVQLLVERGADMNGSPDDAGGITPLMAACRNGHQDVVRFLVEGIANVHAETVHFKTALYYACEGGHSSVVRILVEEGGAAVNAAHVLTGYTPLMCACALGHLEVVRYLVDEGRADFKAASKGSGATALTLACEKDHLEVVRFLVKEGRAGVNCATASGETALLTACAHGSVKVVRYLLKQKGVDVNAARPSDGMTPLMLASASGRLDICDVLLKAKASKALKSASGKTAHQLAAEFLARLKP